MSLHALLRATWQAIGLCALACVALPVPAQEVVIYRCTDAAGALTVQNQRCPKGVRQEVKRMQAPRAAPLPPPPATMVAPATAEAAPATNAPAAQVRKEEPPPPPVEEKPAPPPLYDCRRRDQTQYLSEDLESARYCVPLQVTGLDGNPRTGAGEACEVVTDTCTPVADAQLCDRWRQRLQEAENHWRFASGEHASERQRDYARVRELLASSRCGDGAASNPPQNP
ncbi:MAG TPA: DUF4124 domain-containing protein [Stenotrophomonas sp.]|nr:DUF4124 domain-containing protein [Stenotrophomonas sp.]